MPLHKPKLYILRIDAARMLKLVDFKEPMPEMLRRKAHRRIEKLVREKKLRTDDRGMIEYDSVTEYLNGDK